MRVAIIHDWLLGMRGGERVLEVLCNIFPEADIYTAFCRPEKLSPLLRSRRLHPSPFSRLPGVERYYRYLLPLYPLIAASMSGQLRRSVATDGAYDVVISVSHCLAKNVRVPADTPHICYCLTPMRYIWDQFEAYFGRSPLRGVIKRIADVLRRWDVRSSSRVTAYMGISEFVCRRIRDYYGVPAEVVYPPVPVDWIAVRDEEDRGSGFLCVSALVPYKNIETVIEAFNRRQEPLTIVGSGPEKGRLRALATGQIEFREDISSLELAALYRSSKALLFAAEEDFGMVPVEMQAAGRPVICYGRGGALETVVAEGPAATGIFFNELSAQAIDSAISEFISRQTQFSVDNCIRQAARFSLERFESEFKRVISACGVETGPTASFSSMRREQC